MHMLTPPLTVSRFAWRSTAAACLLALSGAGAQAAAYEYSFTTFFDPTTADVFDTRSVFEPVARLLLEDTDGGVRFTLSQPMHSFPAATAAGTLLQTLWLNGPAGQWAGVSGVPLVSGTGRLATPVAQDAGLTYNWRFAFGTGSFTEGSSATWTVTGNGVTAASFIPTFGWPMLTLVNAGAPYNGNPGGALNFIAARPVAVVPEPGTVVLMLTGLAAIGGMAAVRRQQQIRPPAR